MQAHSCEPLGQTQAGDVTVVSTVHTAWSHCGVRWTIGIAIALLVMDATMFGAIGWSCLICPIWFVFSIFKNIIQRPGWRLACLRIAAPPVTLMLVLANYAVQYRIGAANVQEIITACEEFQAANDAFPKSLHELVPTYIPFVPYARYSMYYNKFVYHYMEGRPLLVWYVVPPYGRNTYSFEEQKWQYID